MDLGDIVDGAFRLLRANFRTLVIIVAVVSAPVELISSLASRSRYGGEGLTTIFHNATNVSAQQQTTGSSTLVTLLASLAALLILPYAAGAISMVVAASYVGESISPGAALRATGRRALPLLGAWVLIHLMEIVGGVFLFLPGLLVMALSVCVAPAIVIERLGPIQGIRRSWQLNRHRVWSVLGIALLSGVVVSIIGTVVAALPDAMAFAVGLRWGWILLFFAHLLSSLLTLPLTAIIATLIYFDGRIRYEGFDLQILARRAAS